MIWTAVIIGLLAVNLIFAAGALWRIASLAKADPHGEIERSLREEMTRNREETAASAREQREEIAGSVRHFSDSVLARMTEIAGLQQQQIELFAQSLGTLTKTNEQKLEALRATIDARLAQFSQETQQGATQSREEMTRGMAASSEAILTRMTGIAQLQKGQLETFATQLGALTKTNADRLDAMRETVERKLAALQQDNAEKLEQMRATVDEKLHATLEQRLGESFKLVSERLEQVHSGLGEMRQLATDVGGLQKVLTNIKTRGCWGEVQLGNLLEQMLTPDQFAKNVATNPLSNERVEYAVKLPGREVSGAPVWLPIDAKFPQEEYQRLLEAQEHGDVEAAETASAALEASVKREAKKIAEKYLNPPHTTDFGIMFLPTEGLFAEVLRRPGLCESMQRNRVLLSGPTNLAAMLSSLQMGFRTLAIEKRSSEVWNVLGAVKTEFGKFGAALEKVQKKLHEASSSIDQAAVRSRAVARQLQSAQELPAEEATKMLGSIEAILPMETEAEEAGLPLS